MPNCRTLRQLDNLQRMARSISRLILNTATIFIIVFLFAFANPSKRKSENYCDREYHLLNMEDHIFNSPIIIHGRILEIASGDDLKPMKSTDMDAEIDALVLVVSSLRQPEGMQLPATIVIKGLVIPMPNATRKNSRVSKHFGCLQSFQSNVKFTFLLQPTTRRLINKWIDLPIFTLSGPIFPYNEVNNRRILNYICTDCYKPIIHPLHRRDVIFGTNFNETCIVKGNPLPSVAWHKGAYPVDMVSFGQNIRVDVIALNGYTIHAILEIDSLVLPDNGDYYCKASNTLGMTQKTLQLRVSMKGVTADEKEDALDARKLVPCESNQNHCLNGGECFMKKTERLEGICSCLEGFMGDQCQFSTSGIAVRSQYKIAGSSREFWIQLFLQGFLICLFGGVTIALVVFWRYKDQSRKKLRKIKHCPTENILHVNKYIQVNTYDPPPKRCICSDHCSHSNSRGLCVAFSDARQFCSPRNPMRPPDLVQNSNSLPQNASLFPQRRFFDSPDSNCTSIDPQIQPRVFFAQQPQRLNQNSVASFILPQTREQPQLQKIITSNQSFSSLRTPLL